MEICQVDFKKIFCVGKILFFLAFVGEVCNKYFAADLLNFDWKLKTGNAAMQACVTFLCGFGFVHDFGVSHPHSNKITKSVSDFSFFVCRSFFDSVYCYEFHKQNPFLVEIFALKKSVLILSTL